MTAEVVPLGVTSLQDMLALLEALATRIRDGEMGHVERMALVIEAGDGISVRSWGGTGHLLEAAGLLTVGIAHLMQGAPL